MANHHVLDNDVMDPKTIIEAYDRFRQEYEEAQGRYHRIQAAMRLHAVLWAWKKENPEIVNDLDFIEAAEAWSEAMKHETKKE